MNRMPIEIYFDCESVSSEMRDWLIRCGATFRATIDQPKVEVCTINSGRPSHTYAGSKNIRIFFDPKDQNIALMFLLKFRTLVFRHNLPEQHHVVN
jgi:hypothetical protein